MTRDLIHKPYPAMAVALVALFVAMGGTGYAALNLPSHSVGAKQLKNGAVTPRKLAGSTIRLLKGVPGPTGPPGLQGPTGDRGTNGINGINGSNGINGTNGATNVVVRSGSVTVPANDAGITGAVAHCNPGEVATGGGAQLEGYPSPLVLQQSEPLDGTTTAPPTGWIVFAANPTTSPRALDAFVICASP